MTVNPLIYDIYQLNYRKRHWQNVIMLNDISSTFTQAVIANMCGIEHAIYFTKEMPK